MAIRSVRLSSSPTVQQTRERRSASQIPTPDQRMYGVFGPSYAGYLGNTAQAQGPTDSAALAALNAFALRENAEREAEQYAAMLTRAQDMQAKAGQDAIYGDLMEDVAGRGPAWADKGMLGVETIEVDPQTGRPYIQYDPVHQQVGNANVLNSDQAERFDTYMGAIVKGREAGVSIPDDYVGKLLTPPTQREQVQVQSGTAPLTPDDQTRQYGTDEGLSFEEQLQLALAGKDGEDDDIGEVTLNHGATGEVPTLTYKGTPEQVAKARQRMIDNGLDPDTGAALNPKADATGSGASANKSLPKNKTTERVEMAPSDGFFAPEKIGSKKGMRKHPILGVNRMHNGDDYPYPKGTPIPAERNGVVLFSGPVKGFGNQVKIRYEDGSVVSYSHNASNSVKPGDQVKKGQVIGKVGSTGMSTGSHVHRQIHSQGNPEKVYATRLKSHPLVVDAQVVDDKVLVTMKDGTQRVYQKGKRIG